MARLQLDAFLDDDAVETPPIPSTAYPEGHVYRIPSPDGATGLYLSRLAVGAFRAVAAEGRSADDDDGAPPGLVLDDDEERDLYEMVLGPTYDEMIADGVSWVRIQKLGKYLFLYFGLSPETADAALASGALLGEASAPNRAARRAAAKTSSSRTSSRPGRGSRASTRTTASAPTA